MVAARGLKAAPVVVAVVEVTVEVDVDGTDVEKPSEHWTSHSVLPSFSSQHTALQLPSEAVVAVRGIKAAPVVVVVVEVTVEVDVDGTDVEKAPEQ